MKLKNLHICLTLIFSLLISSQIDNELTSIPCSDCHSSGGWDKLTYSNFIHSETGFSLNGVHKIQRCNDCHLGNTIEEKHNFHFGNSNCNSCHIDIHLQELGSDCEQCHNENSWDVDERKFNHNQTRFPLIKGHQNINCNECHINTTSQFSSVSTECKSCHIDDFMSTGIGQYSNSPSHITMQYSQNCQECHSISKWAGVGFNHDETGFILSGSHQSADCEQCHSEGNYNLPNSCEGCHNENGIASSNSTQSNYDHSTHVINQDCEKCHNDLDWGNNLFLHSDFTGNDCEECHQPEYIESENPPHGNGNINDNCSLCHVSTNEWAIDPFIHSLIQTSYELNGLHLIASCESCHASQQYNNTSQECESCHLQDYEQAENPNHQLYQYPTQYCSNCHDSNNWSNNFLHVVNDACESCHMPDYENATNPNHSQLSTSCINCHTDITTWGGAEFNHDETGFILSGSHQLADCEQCHSEGNYNLPNSCEGCHNENGIASSNSTQSNYDHSTHVINQDCEKCHNDLDWGNNLFLHSDFTGNDCEECHQPEYIESENPPHGNGNINDNCSLCHVSTNEWAIDPFIHSLIQTSYELNGLHLIASCESCHASQQYNNTSQECESCHLQDYEQAENPNHQLYQYPTQYCSNCHDSNNWSNNFLHVVNDACESCHMPDYENATNPNHSQLSTSCINCHTDITTWGGAEFNHDETGFILSGSHQLADCEQCHSEGNYNLPNSCEGCHNENGIASSNSTQSNYDHSTHVINQDCEKCHNDLDWGNNLFLHSDFTGNDCEECHQPEYIESENPPHGNGNINDNCSLCHVSTNEWAIDPFIHSLIQTSYELNGLHLIASCESCHASQQYNNTSQECESCHLQDYEQAENPNHQLYQYPENYCSLCHETLGWEPDIFMHMVNDVCESCHIIDYENATNPNHSQLSTSCINCHTDITTWEGAEFDHSNISENCNSCHESEFELAENPPHDGFSTQCEDCHNSTETWEEATFSHNNISDGCFNCHEDEFNEEHDNDFPTTCETCHEVDDWDDLNYNHDNDYFPIYNGEHRSEWSSCTAECHIVSDDFSQFSCGLNGVCHEHRQSEMDGEHGGENGYVYESSACFDCHPNGEEDDIIINNFHNRILKRVPWNILKNVNNKPNK